MNMYIIETKDRSGDRIKVNKVVCTTLTMSYAYVPYNISNPTLESLKKEKRPSLCKIHKNTLSNSPPPKRTQCQIYTRSITYGKSNASLASANLITLPPPEEIILAA